MPAEDAVQPAATAVSFGDAVAGFLDYLGSYRGYSIHTVKAYARDLREFLGLLRGRYPGVVAPDQVQRQMVVQFALSLKGQAPLTVRRKLTAIASFYNYLQDTGHAVANPARGLPLPKVAQRFPTCLTGEQARALLEAAHTPWHCAMIALLLFAGLRRSEVAAITLDDLDMENAQLLVRGKGEPSSASSHSRRSWSRRSASTWPAGRKQRAATCS